MAQPLSDMHVRRQIEALVHDFLRDDDLVLGINDALDTVAYQSGLQRALDLGGSPVGRMLSLSNQYQMYRFENADAR